MAVASDVLRQLDTTPVVDTRRDQGDVPFDMADTFFLKRPLYSEEFAGDVLDKVADFYTDSAASAVMGNRWKAYHVYHGLEDRGTSLSSGNSISYVGEQAEFAFLDVNQFRNFVQHQKGLLTQNRPAWDPQALNGDADSRDQVQLTRNLLDFAMFRNKMDEELIKAAEIAVVTGASFAVMGWDAGRRPGDRLTVSIKMPWEVTHDTTRHYKDCEYWIVRDWISRGDVVHRLNQMGKYADAGKIAHLDQTEDDFIFSPLGAMERGRSSQIPVYRLFARRSKYLPQGRYAEIVGDRIFLTDGPLPYKDVPIARMCPSEFLGTSEPIGDSWSLLAIQDAYNAVMSTMLTRVDAMGVPNVMVQEGSDISVDSLGGLNYIQYAMGTEPPRLLDLFQMPGALPQLLGIFEKAMESISGINSVTRGTPAENISSGSMAALVESMSVQFNNALERSYTHLIESCGTFVVQLFQTFAGSDEIIEVSGRDEQWTVSNFKRDSLSSIGRVLVKQVNSLSKHTAGKMELANQLLANGMISSRQEYLTALETGTVEPIFHDPVTELSHIKRENEELTEGRQVLVVVTDNHPLHIEEHSALLSTTARKTPMAQAILQHIAEHSTQWQQATMENPAILAAKKVPPAPLPPQMQMAMMGGMPGPGGPPQQPQQPQQQAGPGGPKPTSGNGPTKAQKDVRGVDNRAGITKEPSLPNRAEPAQVKGR